MYEERLIFKEIEGFPEHHASTITVLPDGDLLAAWYSCDYEGAINEAIFYSRFSIDKGVWSKPKVLVKTPNYPDGNPVLFTDKNGRVWLFYVTMYKKGWEYCKVKYTFSDDQGETWNEPRILIDELGYMTRNEPIYLSNGVLLLPLYDERDWSSLMYLTKNFEEWVFSDKIRCSTGCIQPSVVELSDNTLLAYMRRGRNGKYAWMSISRDFGKTWSQSEETKLKNPNSAIELIKLKNGNLLTVFNDSFNKRTPLVVSISLDEGKTWGHRKILESEKGEFSYPTAMQDKDGLIHILYTYKRLSIKHVTIDEEWVLG